jgi:hypothetical protein
VNNTQVASKIEQRRRQVLVHSVLYYKFDTNLVVDHVYDKWGKELITLQEQYPKLSKKVRYHFNAFSMFSGTTSGYDLPLDDPGAVAVARRLMRLAEQYGHTP